MRKAHASVKTFLVIVRVLLFGTLALSVAAPSFSGAGIAAGVAAPQLTPITATFYPPITTYVEDATAAPGDRLTYTWTKDTQRDCGVFQQGATAQNQATWSHPDTAGGGNCPDEQFHPGVITVVVTDGQWQCTATYPLGSAPGIGPTPPPCVEVNPVTATPTPTGTGTPTTTGTPTATGTSTATGTPTNTGTPTDTVTPTNTPTPTASPTSTATETPKPGCHPRVDVLFNVKAIDPQDPRIIYIFYAIKGEGFYPGGPIVVTLDSGLTLTTGGDSSGRWLATFSASVDSYPPGPHRLKAVQGDPSSDNYCFKNATFDTNTAEVQKLIKIGQEWLKKIYKADARDIKRAGNGAKAFGAGIALYSLIPDATIIGIPVGVAGKVIGAVSGAVGVGLGWVGDEEANWANDPPDLAISSRADLYAPPQKSAVSGLPPRLSSAFNVLLANIGSQALLRGDTATSINRASTALHRHNTACEVFQYQNAVADARRVDSLVRAEPKLIQNLVAAFHAAGVRHIVISPALLRTAIAQVRAHGLNSATDAYLRQVFGARRAGLAEAAALREFRAEPMPSRPVDLLQLLSAVAAEKPYPAAPFAIVSTGFGVQGNPHACKG